MQCTIKECGPDFWLNNAYLHFPPQHPFVWLLMSTFALEFNGNVWGFNGPRVVSTLFIELLCMMPGSAKSECEGVALLPVSKMAPLNWGKYSASPQQSAQGKTLWLSQQ